MPTQHARKPGKGRIMVQVWDQIARAVTRDFKALHLKRNSYLNDLFQLEIERLVAEVQFQNPDGFHERLVQRQLPQNEKVKWTLELDTEVIDRIGAVLADRHIPRDSFVNRVLFFLVANKRWLDRLGVAYERAGRVDAKPLKDVQGYLQDPFFHIREANDGLFYSLCWFPDSPIGTGGPNLFAFNVAIKPEDWEALNTEIDDSFLFDLGITPPEETRHAD